VLTRAAYEEIGRVSAAITGFAESIYCQLDEGRQKTTTALSLFRGMMSDHAGLTTFHADGGARGASHPHLRNSLTIHRRVGQRARP
jgi:hypothetical protein